MIQFPIQGDFREILMIFEAIIVVLNIQFGIIFFNKFLKEKGTKNYMHLAWAVFFPCFAVTFLIFILSDFFVPDYTRPSLLNIGYILIGFGEVFFSFSVEREMKMNKYIITIIISSLTAILIINSIAQFVNSTIISIGYWILLLILFISYSNEFIVKIKRRWKLNIYLFITGGTLAILGWAGTSDLGMGILGVGTRLIGDIFIIAGTSLVALLFIGLPRLEEIDWSDKIRKIYVMHDSGRGILEYLFRQYEIPEEKEEKDAQLAAGSLTAVTQVITKLIKSKEHLEVVDHGDAKIMFEYGKNTINVLIVDEVLEILKSKLKDFTNEIENLYQNVLPAWDGDTSQFTMLESIIKQIFE